ncbi:hypothetical protein ACQT3V_10160 [Brucella sp. NF 2653]
MTDKISGTRLLAAGKVVEKLATLYLKEKGFSGPVPVRPLRGQSEG